MSCYHPYLGLRPKKVDHDTGELNFNLKYSLKIVGPYDPEKKKKIDENEPLYDAVMIPCGQCTGCRLDHSRRWADRMFLEYDVTRKACFITLTYDNEHLPFGEQDRPTLKLQDFQLFMKRLRQKFKRDYGIKDIRFYMAGEYGSKGRPHYHLILFGVSLEDFPDRKIVGKNELKQFYYKSKWLDAIWKNGLTCVCDVSWATFAYVARYVQKKLKGNWAYIYDELGISPEFSTMSRDPGIASPWLTENGFDLDVFKTVFYLPTGRDGKEPVEMEFPKYFMDKLALDFPEEIFTIKEERRALAEDALLLELQNTELSFEEYMQVKEDRKKTQTKNLHRNLDEEKISLNL